MKKQELELITRLKEWKNLISKQNGTGIFGWSNVDERAYKEMLRLLNRGKNNG